MKNNKIFAILGITLILAFAIFSVGAEETGTGVASQNVNSITAFFNNLFHNAGQFSVVGNDRVCGLSGGNPNYQWTVASGSNFMTGTVLTGSRPTSLPANVIIDIFTNGWTPFLETKNFLTYGLCGTGPCGIQVYTCPNAEPTSQANCNSGTIFTSVSCPTWTGTSFYKCPTEQGIPYQFNSYSYCAVSSTMKCYYRKNNVCSESYTNTYAKSNFPNACHTYTYQDAPLYDDLASCNAAIGNSCTVNRECPSNKPVCCSGICNADCSTPPTPTNPTCSDGIQNQGETGMDCGGPCSACSVTPTPADPTVNGKVIIYDLAYSNSDGTKVTGDLIKGQQIRVTFSVKLADNSVFIKPYLVEAGIIPEETAKAWDMAKPSGFYSIFNLFAVQEASADSCCLGQSNIADNLDNMGGLLGKQIQTFDYTIRVPDSNTQDLCGNEKYWGGNSPNYYIYVIVKNGCYKDGFLRNVFITLPVNIGNASESNEGKVCTTDGECGEYEICIKKNWYSSDKTCQSSGTVTSNGTRLIDVKKVSLTKDKISTATDDDLLAASCLGSPECITLNDNYTSTCRTIASLRKDGTLSEAQQTSFFTHAKSVLKTGAYTTIGSTLGCMALYGSAALSLGPGAVISVPAALGGCAIFGGLLGLGTGTLQTAYYDIKNDDQLVSKLSANDANSVGICTAEPKGLDFTGFLEKIGKTIPIPGLSATTSGIVVLVIGFFVIVFLMNSLGGKK